MLVREPSEQAFSGALKLRDRGILISFSSALVLLLASWFILGRGLAPLRKIATVAKSIQQGNTDVDIPLLLQQDEIGILSNSLHDMQQASRQREEDLEKLVKQRTYDLQKLNLELQSLSDTDSLLNVANRRRLDEYFDIEWRRAWREQEPFTLMLLDIDHFKSYNDFYGHIQGDNCLKRVAEILQLEVKRPSDLLARFGGEEFAIVLPNTDVKGAVILAERIQSRVRAAAIENAALSEQQIVTISIGISGRRQDDSPDVPSDMFERADKYLYQAKEAGRDRIVSEIDVVI